MSVAVKTRLLPGVKVCLFPDRRLFMYRIKASTNWKLSLKKLGPPLVYMYQISLSHLKRHEIKNTFCRFIEESANLTLAPSP